METEMEEVGCWGGKFCGGIKEYFTSHISPTANWGDIKNMNIPLNSQSQQLLSLGLSADSLQLAV